MHERARPPVLLTYDDYCRIPDDGKRHEILEGIHYVSPVSTPGHQIVLAQLVSALAEHVELKNLGTILFAPCDVLLHEHTIVQPDLIFIASARIGIIGPKNIQGAPDLPAEVVSPSNSTHDTRTKYPTYARFDIPHYWIVDPTKRRLTEFTEPQGSDYASERVFGGDDSFIPRLFPNLTVKVSSLFPT